MKRLLILAALLPSLAFANASAYEVQNIRVIDGDTFAATVHLWPGLVWQGSIRVAGIDAPETGGRAECETERDRGNEAQIGCVSCCPAARCGSPRCGKENSPGAWLR